MSSGRTTFRTVILLLTSGVIVGSLVRPIAVWIGTSAPRVSWVAAGVLAAAAAVVAALGWTTWQALHKRRQRMTSDHGVKLLALAKSCVIVGGFFAGSYAGYAIAWLDDLDTQWGQERALHSAVAAAAGLVLLGAALFLEWACRIPGDDDEGTATGTASSAA